MIRSRDVGKRWVGRLILLKNWFSVQFRIIVLILAGLAILIWLLRDRPHYIHLFEQDEGKSIVVP